MAEESANWEGLSAATVLFELRPVDIQVSLGVAVVLGAVTLLAGYAPARRAAALNPVEVLKHGMKTLIALALLAASTASAPADATDDFIKAEMQRQRIPGLSLVILQNGVIVKAAGYGLADVKLKTPATLETVYKICSVSKQFIATGIMLLVQEGRLGVDDPISKYLEATPAAWKPITIRHLLTHTSGIVREAPGFDPFKIQSDAEVIKTAYPLPLGFAPGEKWEYSNTGYFALAEIIRKVTGRPWTEYLEENVFRPSGMTMTRPTNTKEIVPNRAAGYTDNDKLRDAREWPALRPSGAFLSTVLDMARWDAVLYTDRILRESTRREMWTPVTLINGTSYPYGFGWQLGSLKGHKQVHHGGGMPGFRAGFARFPDARVTIIVLMNLDDVDLDAIVGGVAAFYLPERKVAAIDGRNSGESSRGGVSHLIRESQLSAVTATACEVSSRPC